MSDDSQQKQQGTQGVPQEPVPIQEPIVSSVQDVEPELPATDLGDVPPTPPADSESFLDFLVDEPVAPESKPTNPDEEVSEVIDAEESEDPDDLDDDEILIENEQPEEQPTDEGQELVIDAEPPAEKILEDLDKESFGEKLVAILEELNISRGQVLSIFGCLFAAVLIVAGGYWGFDLFNKYGDRLPFFNGEDKEDEIVNPPDEVPEEIDTGIKSLQQFGKVSESNLRSLGETGVRATLSFGGKKTQSSRIADSVLLFRQLDNAFDIDIDQLLAGTTDRRSRLRSYIAQLKKLYVEGNLEVEQLSKEMDDIRFVYEEGKIEESVVDANFFEQLNALNGELSQSLLDDFIIVSQQQIGRKARFQALSKIKSFFTDGLPKVDNKIKAMELNEVSIVQGIKFFEVPGVDLGLYKILDKEGGAQSAGSQPSSLSGSLGTISDEGITTGLPIHPTEVRTTRDYITQPGGGFE